MPFGYSAPASAAGGGGGGAGQIEFTVTVAASKFVIDTVSQQVLTLLPGMIYRFDVSDSSNSGHLLQFSTTVDGTNNSGSQYSSGYTTNGVAGDGASDTYVQLDVPVNAPDELYYFCATSGHTGYGAAATLTAIAGAAAGVTTVATKAALDAITPSTVPGQFYFVTANKGMYYSNNTSWTLLGSNSPAWGSFTEDYGKLTHTSAGGGDAGYSDVVLAISGNETISESGTMDSAADPFWRQTKILMQSRSQEAGEHRSMFNRANRTQLMNKTVFSGGIISAGTQGPPRGATNKYKFGTSSFQNVSSGSGNWQSNASCCNFSYMWDMSYVPYDTDWTAEMWISHNDLTSANAPNLDNIFWAIGPVQLKYLLQNGRFEVMRSYRTANDQNYTNTELTGLRYSYSSSSSGLLDGNWRHLAWQKEGTAGSMYMNGARVAYDATAYSTEMFKFCSSNNYLLGEYNMSSGLADPAFFNSTNGFENRHIALFSSPYYYRTHCNWDDARFTVGQARYTGSSAVEWDNDKYTTAAGATTSWTEPTAYNPVIGHESFDGVTRTITDRSPTAKTVYLSGGIRQTSSTPQESANGAVVTLDGIVDSTTERWKKAAATAPSGWDKAFTSGYDHGALYVKGGSGSGDAGDAFNFANGNFTIEFWIWLDNNWSAQDGGYCVVMDFRDSDANLGNNWTGTDTEPFIRLEASNERFAFTIGALTCYTGGDGSTAQGWNHITPSGYSQRSDWIHVAFIRTGTSLVGYQNGIAGSAVTDNKNYNTNDYGITIGRSARHITSGTGRVYQPFVGTSPTWTYGDGLEPGGNPTNYNQYDDYQREGGVGGQIQDIRITKSARTAPALDGSYMGAPYHNLLEFSDGGVTHNPTATGAAASGYPQATSTLVATDEPGSNVVFAPPTNVAVSDCTHSPPHTGPQTIAAAGLTVGASSGDVEITPPSAWEGDTVTAAVTASDGVNILEKNITWSIGGLWPSTDSNFSDVDFLAHLDGSASDVTGNNTFTNNTAIFSTSEKKWGSGSIDQTDTNNIKRLWYVDTYQYTSTKSFTWECWVKMNAFQTGQTQIWRSPYMISKGNTYGGLGLFYNIDPSSHGNFSGSTLTGQTFAFWAYMNGGSYDIFPHHTRATLDGNWHHLAFSCDATRGYMFVDGILSTQSGITWTWAGMHADTWSSTLTNTNSIGGGSTQEAHTFARAYVDDVRITHDVCRYTADFTLPGGAFQDS